jgi:hypothetical protein
MVMKFWAPLNVDNIFEYFRNYSLPHYAFVPRNVLYSFILRFPTKKNWFILRRLSVGERGVSEQLSQYSDYNGLGYV